MSTGADESPRSWPGAEWNGLEVAVRRLIDARDAWRRRALEAERRVCELESALDDVLSGKLDPVELTQRVEALASENRALRERVVAAREKVRGILQRLEMLEEVR